jgi:hypothetical protein
MQPAVSVCSCDAGALCRHVHLDLESCCFAAVQRYLTSTQDYLPAAFQPQQLQSDQVCTLFAGPNNKALGLHTACSNKSNSHLQKSCRCSRNVIDHTAAVSRRATMWPKLLMLH